MNTHIIIHYDEIGLKGNNRASFELKLLKNVQKSLKLDEDVLWRESGRLVVRLSQPFEEIKSLLAYIPGIVSYSPGQYCTNEIDKMNEIALKIISKFSNKSFKISTKRSWKQFKFISPKVSEIIGSHVVKNTDLKVNLSNPDITIFIEIDQHGAYLYDQKFNGVGGLPMDTAGKVISLISGGIDSPVASYQMMKRGARNIFVHCWNAQFVMEGVKNKVADIIEILNRYQQDTVLYLIPFGDIQLKIIEKVPSRYRMIIYRRIMIRIADKIRQLEGAEAIVTGDSLAQVASQTLTNLSVIQEATHTMLLNPLIGWDKRDITEVARKIETFELSIQPYFDCCRYLISKKPILHANLTKIHEQESSLDIDQLVQNSLDEAELIHF